MAQNFKNQLENVSDSAEDILDAVNSFDAVVGIRLSNVAAVPISVDVYIVRASPSGTFYLIKSATIDVGQSLELIDGGSKIVLQSGDKIMAVSDTATSLDTVVSYVDAIST
jgi:hypothetical protein|tara:strand:- start:508 stop:840 length:333 start_codon:yes stop_codon:yes gene_type:complete